MLSRTVFGLALSCVVALLVPARAAHAAGSLPSPTIQTAEGPVSGTVTDTISTFLGIPYAAAPVGDLRWRPPQPRTPWKEPLDATKFASQCPQGTSTDEDCLFLNVYVPTKALPARGGRRVGLRETVAAPE